MTRFVHRKELRRRCSSHSAGRGRHHEGGFTLIELLIAMGIFSLVVVSVDVTVTMLTARSTGLSQSSQAIDQLQTAEQAVVQDIHAASSWSSTTPPSSVATTLSSALTANTPYTSLSVASAKKAIEVGDTIVVGSGSNADTFTATAAASVGATSISVSGTTSYVHPIGDAVYDTATVPLVLTDALYGTPLSVALNPNTSYTSLSLSSGLKRPVSAGDTIVVGTGSTADDFVASASAAVGAKTISVNSKTPANDHPVGDSVYDSNTSIILTTNADTSRTLTITTNGSSPVTVSNLDPSSGFSYRATTISGTTYYTAIGVTLTMDTPRVNAPRATKTTASDTNVQAWNLEFACTDAQDSPC